MAGRKLSGLARIVLLVTLVLGCAPGEDARPSGTLDDVARLSERSDLNVLFVLVDTLRANRLGAYGYARDTSPNIDSLAETGVRFAHHISQSSWTKCSMASLWTGLYPNRSGVLHAQHALAESAVLPAELFLEAGFRTAAIWRNGWIAPNFGFGQGFEVYHSPSPFIAPQVQRAHPENVAAGDGDVIRSANVFMRSHARERWFLYLHLMDVHQYSYDPTSALFGTSYADSYDNAIRWVDSLLGHLLTELDRLALRDRTLIVLAGDHGEAFGEHGGEGHARNVHGEVTETPFIISFPFRLSPGLTVNGRSQNVDIWPTLLDLLDMPELLDADGTSLLHTLQSASQTTAWTEDERPAFAQLDAAWARDPAESLPLVALNWQNWRLMYDARVPQRPQLFDKHSDPSELRNLAAQEPELVEQLVETLEAYLAENEPPWGESAPVIEIDELQLQQLRAIGYGVQ